MLTLDQARRNLEEAERARDRADQAIVHGYGPPGWRYSNADEKAKALGRAQDELRETEKRYALLGSCGWCDQPAVRRTPIQTAGGMTVQVNICETHG